MLLRSSSTPARVVSRRSGRRLRTTIAALAVGVGSVLLAPAPAPAAVRADTDPLVVSIESMAPSVVPAKGPLVVTGRVFNTSNEEWRGINVYPLLSTTPLTSHEELVAALALDPAVEVGERDLTISAAIQRLGPGESAPYRLRLPHRSFGTEPGVYWLQVHALGETDAGRADGADGRARTFLPLVPGRGSIETALVLPVRRSVRHTPDGRVAGPDSWLRDLSTGGLLASRLAIAQGAGARPLTWVVDPAVPEAAGQLADGNLGFRLGPTRRSATEASPGEEESGSAAPDPVGTEPGESLASAPQETAASALAGRAARDWLDATQRALVGDQLLALPYGDLDVMATLPAASTTVDLRELADTLTGRRVTPWGVPADPVISPATGFLDVTALTTVAESTPVLLRDTALTRDPDDPTAVVPAVVRVDGRQVLLSATGPAAGGPGPDDPLATVSLRQRILAEAAVRRLTRTGPFVMTLPTGWRPDATAAAQLFEGLDVPWLRLTTLADVAQHRGKAVASGRVRYSPRQRSLELAAGTVSEVAGLVTDGRLLDSLLPETDAVADQVARAALPAASYAARRNPGRQRGAVAGMSGWVHRRLNRVELSAPSSVTLSSDSGSLATSVTNNLDQPVRVRVIADVADSQLRIEPSQVVEIDPGGRADLLLQAESSVLGVHEVTLRVADEDGLPLGPSATFPLTSAQVSDVIWVVIGGGAAILFGAIVLRNVRRIRGRGGRRPGPQPADEPALATEGTEERADA